MATDPKDPAEIHEEMVARGRALVRGAKQLRRVAEDLKAHNLAHAASVRRVAGELDRASAAFAPLPFAKLCNTGTQCGAKSVRRVALPSGGSLDLCEKCASSIEEALRRVHKPDAE